MSKFAKVASSVTTNCALVVSACYPFYGAKVNATFV